MTRIDFHSNVADRQAYACRLLRKASAQGVRVLVLADGAELAPLDLALWALAETEFLPHCLSSAAPELLAASPVVLHAAGTELPAALQADVLLNLAAVLPAGFERFERLIEILGQPERDAEGVALGRQRWKHYKSRGYALSNHTAR